MRAMGLMRFKVSAKIGQAVAVTVLALSVAAPVKAGERTAPIVVELFTSQGCNSCPPADEYLGELAKRPDVLALSLHVDYWDYIGWKDPFAQHVFTLRQREYSRALAQRYVYTPQMVINGRLQGIGSERPNIEQLIAEAKKERESSSAESPTIALVGDELRIGRGPSGAATVWMAIFDPRHTTTVARGENAGRDLAEYNVVREWTRIGGYDGQPVTLKLDVDWDEYEKSGCAIFVQRQTSSGPGAVLAAYAIDPPMRRK